MTRYQYTVFAQAYGQNAYNTCDYNCAQGSGASTGTSGSSGSSPLADTGIVLIGIVTLACLIIFVALVVRMAGRRRRATAVTRATGDATRTAEDSSHS